MTDGRDAPILAALAEQRRLGILGLSPEDALAHSRSYVAALDPAARGGRVLDLGSGAGIPGLVIAWDRADLLVTLLDARRRRADQLVRLVRRLGLAGRVRVVGERADVAGAAAEHRVAYDAVVARRFGPPATLLGLAEAFLRPGGIVVVSAAPDDRWSGRHGWAPRPAPHGLVVLARDQSGEGDAGREGDGDEGDEEASSP